MGLIPNFSFGMLDSKEWWASNNMLQETDPCKPNLQRLPAVSYTSLNPLCCKAAPVTRLGFSKNSTLSDRLTKNESPSKLRSCSRIDSRTAIGSRTRASSFKPIPGGFTLAVCSASLRTQLRLSPDRLAAWPGGQRGPIVALDAVDQYEKLCRSGSARHLSGKSSGKSSISDNIFVVISSPHGYCRTVTFMPPE